MRQFSNCKIFKEMFLFTGEQLKSSTFFVEIPLLNLIEHLCGVTDEPFKCTFKCEKKIGIFFRRNDLLCSSDVTHHSASFLL